MSDVIKKMNLNLDVSMEEIEQEMMQTLPVLHESLGLPPNADAGAWIMKLLFVSKYPLIQRIEKLEELVEELRADQAYVPDVDDDEDEE